MGRINKAKKSTYNGMEREEEGNDKGWEGSHPNILA